MRVSLRSAFRLALFACALTAAPTLAADMTFPVESNLRVGVAKVDITPETPAGIQLAGHPRVAEGARDPLRAAVLLLDDGRTRAAIITLDLLHAWEEMTAMLRDQVGTATNTPPENIMVAVSHNHSAPAFPGTEWGRQFVARIAAAAQEAAGDMRTASIGYGEDEITFNVNRRKVIDGRAVVRLNPDGPCDRRVKVLRFDDGQSLEPLAVIMHAVCHPCFFTWGDNGSPPYPNGYPLMSADFPGVAQTFVEKMCDRRTKTLFLQGCAGDIRPDLPGYPYRCADEADIQWAGAELGGAVLRAMARSVVREQLQQRERHYPIRTAHSVVMLTGKTQKIRAELQALKVGPYLFLTMPGEPMVEYGFKLEQAIADRAIPIIVGYANGTIGYIPTAASHAEGGYEPGRSPLAPEAEQEILDELASLADQVIGDVFESFSKHPRDVERRKAAEEARRR